ncbi:MAG: glycosyltransferase [Actinobacteria bacterium]|nr:glycosyltransferase [Actinomycetota bacterium]
MHHHDRRTWRGGARPTIVFVQDALYESGGTRFTHRVIEAFRESGADARLVVLMDPADDVRRFLPHPDVPVIFACPDRLRLRRALPRAIRSFAGIMRSADLVISSSEVGYAMVAGAALSRALGTPLVSLVQSPLEESVRAWRPARLRPLVRWANRHVDLAACVSEGVRQTVISNGLPAERTTTLRVGADTLAVRAAGTPAITRSPGTPPRLVAMGRLQPVKGFHILIQASALLKERGRDHRILIVGEGDQRAYLEELIARQGVSEEVTLTGFEPNPQPLLAGADAFILSSLFEGSGGTVLFEALTHAVPVIATDCVTGPRMVLADGKYGDLVNVEDPAALADAIEAFLIDPGPLRAKAALGPDRAAEYDQGEAGQELLAQLRARFLQDAWTFAAATPRGA